MTSIFEHTNSNITVHILHDNTLTEDNRQKLIRTAQKYSQQIDLIDIEAYKPNMESEALENVRKSYSIGTLYRLLIPELLPSLEKVIYLDCDVLVNIDIKELWDIDMQGKSLAAAPDFPNCECHDNIYAEKMRNILNGCNPKEYINSGVLLMDLNRIRERGNLFQSSIEWLARRGAMAVAADQDALNSIFAGDIKILPERFNQNVFKPKLPDGIIHVIYGKPWNNIRGIQADRIYWKMFLRSAWGENVTAEEVVDIMNDLAEAKPSSQRLSLKQRIKAFLKGIEKLYNKLVHGIIPTRAIHYILLDIRCRLKYKFSH